MNTIWQLKEQPPKSFYKKFGKYPAPVLSMLWSRGVRKEKDIEKFFRPHYPDDLANPLGIKGMKRCLARLREAAQKNERVLIYGDYDTDGVCGTIILKSLLERLGVRSVDVYLPYREKEGYGLNELAVRSFVLKNISLLITVDCGISNYKEIALAKKFGFDVIVVDHHRSPAKLPPADVILDLHQKGDTYPFKDFCGTGVAFKVLQAALQDPQSQKLGDLSWEWADNFLDLAALATIGDMMPLLGENRVLVTQGIVRMRQGRRPGLKALIEKAIASNGFRKKSTMQTIAAEDIGYVLVPPLNAAGRMDHASGAYNILAAQDEKEARHLADALILQNQEKQKIIQRMLREAEKKVAKLDLSKELVILEGDPSWKLSLVGVVAGRLAEKYWRPVHLFRRDKDESAGGTRTIPGYDLVKALARAQNLLTKFGGHPVAAGWTCPNKNLGRFKSVLVRYAEEVFPRGLPPRQLLIDSEIAPEAITPSLIENLGQFEPFGPKNERPRFLLKDMILGDFETIGNRGKHLRLELISGARTLKGLWFRNGGKVRAMVKGAKLDLVCELEKDDWEENPPLLKIIDLRFHYI